jgi:hypothetical protein
LNSDLIVRLMTQSDLRQVKQVIDVSFPRFYRYFSFHSVQEEGQVLVAELQGTIVGFVKIIDFIIASKSMVVSFGLLFTQVFGEKASL